MFSGDETKRLSDLQQETSQQKWREFILLMDCDKSCVAVLNRLHADVVFSENFIDDREIPFTFSSCIHEKGHFGKRLFR